jgi:hypothetical protein
MCHFVKIISCIHGLELFKVAQDFESTVWLQIVTPTQKRSHGLSSPSYSTTKMLQTPNPLWMSDTATLAIGGHRPKSHHHRAHFLHE